MQRRLLLILNMLTFLLCFHSKTMSLIVMIVLCFCIGNSESYDIEVAELSSQYFTLKNVSEVNIFCCGLHGKHIS